MPGARNTNFHIKKGLRFRRLVDHFGYAMQSQQLDVVQSQQLYVVLSDQLEVVLSQQLFYGLFMKCLYTQVESTVLHGQAHK